MEGNDLNQVADEILVFKYDEDTGTSAFYGILGEKVELNNALVLEVNMIPKRHDIVVIQSPLVSDFVSLVKKMNKNSVTQKEIEDFQNKLENIKKNL